MNTLRLVATSVYPRTCFPGEVSRLYVDLIGYWDVFLSGITRAHLVDSLNRCLASTPKFAPMCLELLFEKLSGMDDEAKVSCCNGVRRLQCCLARCARR